MTRFWIALTAIGAAAAVSSAFDVLFHRIAGAAPSPGYVSVYLGLTALAGLAVAIASSVFVSPARVALALWSALHAALLLGAGAAAGIGPATWLLLPEARDGRGAARLGVVAAAAICLVFVVAPRVGRRVGVDLEASLPAALVYALVLAVGAVALRSRAPLLRRAVVPVALAIVAGFGVAPLWTGRSQPDRHPPHFEALSGDPTRPNVIVLVLDTVGASQVTLDGEPADADTTPSLRGLLAPPRRAVVYPLAYSTSTWTAPAHASLFSGALPSDHGIHEASIFLGDEIRLPTLRAERTLAELLRERGYRTGCIFGNGWLDVIPGFERGFDWFVRPIGRLPFELVGESLRQHLVPTAYVRDVTNVDANLINDRVLRFLELCAPGPCFVVANYFDAHAPYLPGPGYLGRFAGVPARGPFQSPAFDDPEAVRTLALARHREEILELDSAVGRLVAALDERAILDHSWLFVTSDHGEAFGEHGLTEHGTTVYDEVVRVPLIVHPPAGERVESAPGAVGLLDVAATIASIAGARPLGPGRDLRASTQGSSPVPIEFFGNPRKAGRHGALAAEPARAVVMGSTKLIEQRGRLELYHLDEDPDERVDVSAAHGGEVEILSAKLPSLRWRGQTGDAAPGTLSLEEERELRALGYLE